MNMILSTPDGFHGIGLKAYAKANLIIWIAPWFIGALLLGVQWSLGSQSWGDRWLMVWTLSLLVTLSPAVTWFVLILAAPLVAVLMDRGWFGWIPAVLTGMATGALIFALTGEAWVISVGAALTIALRWLLGRWHPAAFALAD